MSTLRDKILALEAISEALEPSEAQRDQYIKEISGFTNNFINTLPTTNAYSNRKDTAGAMALSKDQMTMAQILELYGAEVSSKGINPASG
ncbi:MAG: hypothetical protein HKN09_05490, partial [Saprospiraceae bacterium]|nr:hypothetical protein [Saprospiraceae bacterium]